MTDEWTRAEKRKAQSEQAKAIMDFVSMLSDKIAELEKENKTLEGCLLAEQEHTQMLEQQIEKMKCCGNCKHFDKLYNRCELTRLTLKSCLCNALDKWELRR